MRLTPLVLTLPLALGSTGCIKAMLINGQIEGTRQGSVAFDRFADFEAAEYAAANALVQFEGMLELSPGNEDALFMLTKAYTGYAFGFIEDHMEQAEDRGDRAGAAYHKQRARTAYKNAIAHGLVLLGAADKGFEAGKSNEATLDAWLKQHYQDAEDAPNLFWTGYAWASLTNISKDDAEAVASLYVGVALVRRSVELDPSYNAHSGQIILGGYHARTASAELDEAQRLFEEALTATGRKFLLAQFTYANTLACARADAATYDKLLREVIAAEDPDPSQRLSNMVAKRRAQRWLAPKRMFDACSMDPLPPPSEAPAEASPEATSALRP